MTLRGCVVTVVLPYTQLASPQHTSACGLKCQSSYQQDRYCQPRSADLLALLQRCSAILRLSGPEGMSHLGTATCYVPDFQYLLLMRTLRQQVRRLTYLMPVDARHHIETQRCLFALLDGQSYAWRRVTGVPYSFEIAHF
eukprot:PhF_6_TR15919/c0_g1_i1/m.24620